MTTMNLVTSVVTPDAALAPVVLPKASKVAKAKLNGSTASAPLTPEQACKIAYEYGANLAGQDGSLTLAFKTYAKDEEVQANMVKALCVGYMERKLHVAKHEAERIVGLVKHSPDPKKADDHHRTFEQERVMVAVRVLVHRAKKMAGIGIDTPKVNTPSDEEIAAREARKNNIQQLAEIVYPAKESAVDVDAAMTRLVLTMRAYMNKHAGKFQGDTGMAWRDWLANAPIVIAKK
jgi:hypothetical protein